MISLKRKQPYKAGSLYEHLMRWGRSCGCHQLPERSYYIKGRQFPVCARCMGLLIGYSIGVALLPLVGILDIKLCIAACLMMFADWYIQYLNIAQSHNLRRMMTGTICGIGYLHIWIYVIWRVWEWGRRL